MLFFLPADCQRTNPIGLGLRTREIFFVPTKCEWKWKSIKIDFKRFNQIQTQKKMEKCVKLFFLYEKIFLDLFLCGDFVRIFFEFFEFVDTF